MIELEDEDTQFWVGSLDGLVFYDGKSIGKDLAIQGDDTVFI